MEFKKEIKAHFLKGHQAYLRHISIDCVIFGFHENELKVLLLKSKYEDKWALPGGFVLKEEPLDEAAKRILLERTRLEKIFLQQFYTFGDPARATRKINREFLKSIGTSAAKSWMFERFISVGYRALVDFTKVQPVADLFSESCEWFNIHTIPEMIFDHREIFRKALQDLQLQLNFQPVGYNLLPSKFTMPELQKLYETILDRKLDRRNFKRKMLAMGILIKLKETKKGVSHKAPFYYKLNLSKYKKTLISTFA